MSDTGLKNEAAKPLLWPGSVLLGRYVVERCLVNDPNRSIYSCYDHLDRKRRITLKLLELPKSNRPLSKLWSEIRKIFRIESENVLTLYDCARDKDKLLLFTEVDEVPDQEEEEEIPQRKLYPEISLFQAEFVKTKVEDPTGLNVNDSRISINLASMFTLLMVNSLAALAAAVGDEEIEERLSGVKRVTLPDSGGPGQDIEMIPSPSLRRLFTLFTVIAALLALFTLVVAPPPQLTDWWGDVKESVQPEKERKSEPDSYRFYGPKESKSKVIRGEKD